MAYESSRHNVRSAASFLFVPATRPDRIVKAAASRAHHVVVDLEDAISQDDVAAARANLERLSPDRPLFLRVNPLGAAAHEADMAIAARLSWLAGVVLPKVESAGEVEQFLDRTMPGTAVLALLETPRAIQRADQIALSGAARLIFGSIDYLTSIGADSSAEVLAYPRSRLVVASAAAGIAPPIDGPTLALSSNESVREDAQTAKALGFGGKLCIHPSQVVAVNDTFAPTAERVEWAHRVVESATTARGVFVVDGQMVDEPVVARAREILLYHPSAVE